MKGTTISSFLHPTFLWDCAWVIFLFIPFPIIEHPISFPNFPLQVVLSVMYIKIFLNFNGHFNQQIVPRLFCVHQTKYSSWNVFQLVSFLFLGYWRHMAEVLSHNNIVFFSLLVLAIGLWKDEWLFQLLSLLVTVRIFTNRCYCQFWFVYPILSEFDKHFKE